MSKIFPHFSGFPGPNRSQQPCAMSWNFGEAVKGLRRFLSQTPGRNCLIGVLDIGIEASEIAVTFRAVLAQRCDGACLHQFKKVEARGGTYVWSGCGPETS